MIENSLEDIENNRLESITTTDYSDNIQFIPGSYGYHEALHMASYFSKSICEQLLEHPSVFNDKQAYFYAHKAFDNLFNLYQHLGTNHLQKPS